MNGAPAHNSTQVATPATAPPPLRSPGTFSFQRINGVVVLVVITWIFLYYVSVFCVVRAACTCVRARSGGGGGGHSL